MKKRIKRSKNDLLFDIFSYLVMGVLSVIVIYPLYFVLIASISSPEAVNAGNVILYPIGVTLDGYRKLFEDSRIWMGYRNTIFYAVAGTTLDVCLTLLTAYPLAFDKLPGRKIFMGLFLFTMFFSGGLIPTFLLVKGLHLYDTPFVLILLGALNVYNMIIAKSFFEGTISKDLMDAAEIDGCGKFRFFYFHCTAIIQGFVGSIGSLLRGGTLESVFQCINLYIKRSAASFADGIEGNSDSEFGYDAGF